MTRFALSAPRPARLHAGPLAADREAEHRRRHGGRPRHRRRRLARRTVQDTAPRQTREAKHPARTALQFASVQSDAVVTSERTVQQSFRMHEPAEPASLPRSTPSRLPPRYKSAGLRKPRRPGSGTSVRRSNGGRRSSASTTHTDPLAGGVTRRTGTSTRPASSRRRGTATATLIEEDGHVTDLLTKEAVGFIEKKRAGPFFLICALHGSSPAHRRTEGGGRISTRKKPTPA